MFGYVTPEKPELKIKEYELYRAYYCSVCKTIGRHLGQLARATLTYDAAFLAILISSFKENDPQVKLERCMVHPFKKRGVTVSDEVIEYASDINILLAYYNLEDKWKDDKSLASGAGKLLLERAFNKAKTKLGVKSVLIEEKLQELDILEKQNCDSLDQASEPFAKLMEYVVVYEPLVDGKNEPALKWLGYNLGKWIYLLDAFDDIEKDIEHDAYNPLIKQFGYSGEGVETFKQGIRPRIEFNLTYILNEISKSYELLETKCNKGLIENILYMGMLRKTDNILKMGSCNKIEKSL
jgi:hypothetical protein